MNYTPIFNAYYFLVRKKWNEVLNYKNIKYVSKSTIQDFESKFISKNILKMWNIYKKNVLYFYIKKNDKTNKGIINSVKKIIFNLNINLNDNDNNSLNTIYTYHLSNVRGIKNIIVPFSLVDKKEKCSFVIENVKAYKNYGDIYDAKNRFLLLKNYESLNIIAFGFLYITSKRFTFFNRSDNNLKLKQFYSIFYTDIEYIIMHENLVEIKTKNYIYTLVFFNDSILLFEQYTKKAIKKYSLNIKIK